MTRVNPRRALLADALGLLGVLAVLSYYLRPELLLRATIPAGGDMPCHYPTAVEFYERFLPQLRVHGWYPGAYLGHPLLLYYFPLPFLAIAALAPLAGMPVAFKLGTALGVLLLPPFAYASFRAMGFRFPTPLLGAGAAGVFLFMEDNPIWGGTVASMLTGEFAYSYGVALGVLFLGAAYRAFARGDPPWPPALLLALTALAHGYAVLWAGISATFFLYGARRPARTLAWLAGLAALAFALAAFWLLPLLAAWRWTTPYDDPWISVTARGLAPPYLLPLAALAALGLLRTLWQGRRQGGPDRRLLYLLHAGVVAGALAAAGPALGVIDVRFVPLAQLSVCLAGGASLGLLLEGAAFRDLLALALLAAGLLYGHARSNVIRHWTAWNYSGLEAKELWPAFSELNGRLRGTVGDPRVAVEYSALHERAGSIRVYETLPLFSGRSTLEGVYNQAGLLTHAVYYVASELGASSPNPFRSREYSGFDTEGALRHLRLFNVREIVALSPQLVSALEARDDVAPAFRVPPYAVFRFRDHGPGYVEPLAYAPVRSSPRNWRDKSYRWFTRKPLSPALLVFSDDPRFTTVEPDEYLPPPLARLPPGVKVTSRLERESLVVRTSRPGHPLLVKVAYHPRWRAEGADGPYLVSPGMMMVVPRGREVRLRYGRAASDLVGWALTAAGVGWLLWARRAPERGGAVARGARPGEGIDACGLPRPPRRWGGLVPAALLLLLAAGRLAATPSGSAERQAALLREKASRADEAGRFADAAEYLRHALALRVPAGQRAELLCLRGESLLRAGQPRAALEPFGALQREQPASALLSRAISGEARARDALGDHAGAEAARRRLPHGAGDPVPAGREGG